MVILSIAAISCNNDEDGSQCSSREEISYTLATSSSVSVSNKDGVPLYVSSVKDAGFRIWASGTNMFGLTFSIKSILSPIDKLCFSGKPFIQIYTKMNVMKMTEIPVQMVISAIFHVLKLIPPLILEDFEVF